MRTMLLASLIILVLPLFAIAGPVPDEDLGAKLDEIIQTLDGFQHRLDRLEKRIDDGRSGTSITSPSVMTTSR